jgi:GTPase SAR1 family protein
LIALQLARPLECRGCVVCAPTVHLTICCPCVDVQCSIAGNYIKAQGVTHLAEALAKNTGLERLYVGNHGTKVLWQKGTNVNRLVTVHFKFSEPVVGLGDEEVREICEAAVACGDEVPWGRCKLMLIGHGRAGKTQTLRTLRGLDFEAESPSTVVSATAHLTVDRTVVDSHFVEMEEPVQARDHLARGVAMKLTRRGRVDFQRRQVNAQPKLKSGEARTIGRKLGLLHSRMKNNPTRMLKRSANVRSLMQVPSQTLELLDRDLVLGQRNAIAGDNVPVSFTVWDCGGQQVFHAIHHMFLSSFSVYLLVFDMAELLNETTRGEELEHLKFWLNSVALHAPDAPVVVVGTHADMVPSASGKAAVDELLLGLREKFKALRWVGGGDDGAMLYFPLDNKRADGAGTQGVVALRKTIVAQAHSLDFVKRHVPLSWTLFLDKLLKMDNVATLSLTEMHAQGNALGVRSDAVTKMLAYCHKLGMLLHWQDTPVLSNIVTVDPQWLVNAIARVIHSSELHGTAEERQARKLAGVGRDYEEMMKTGLATRELLRCMWAEFGDDKFEFLVDLMVSAMLMAEWNPDGLTQPERYVVPSVVTGAVVLDDGVVSPRAADVPITSSAVAALDFSEFYLPSGLFPRLVAQCVLASSEFASKAPALGVDTALVWFGGCAVSLRCVMAEERIVVGFSDTHRAAEHLATVRRMLEIIRAEVMAGDRLKYRVLLRSADTPDWIAVDVLMKAALKGETSVPTLDRSRSVALQSLSRWQRLVTTDSAKQQVRIGQVPVDQIRVLGNKFKNHCFLSHKQSEGNHAVGRLQLLLEKEGFSCWLDQNERELNVNGMMDGIDAAKCFLSYVTKSVFESAYVCMEITHAFELTKPFIFLRECDEKVAGFVTFDQARASALEAEQAGRLPNGFTAMMDKCEMLEFRTRDFFLKGVLGEIVGRLDNVCNV